MQMSTKSRNWYYLDSVCFVKQLRTRDKKKRKN